MSSSVENKLTIDFETRSAADLKTVGAWRYAEDPTTDILCLAVKVNDEAPRVWLPPEIEELFYGEEFLHVEAEEDFGMFDCNWELMDLIDQADIIEAHNIGFERAMWREHMVKKYGFSDLPLTKLRDSAAKAAMHAIPRSLEKAVEALGLGIKKDMEGHKLMMKMCKPRPLRKAEIEIIQDEIGDATIGEVKEAYLHVKSNSFNAPKVDGFCWNKVFLKWHEEPEQIARLIKYCCQDVETEHALSEALDDLPPLEQAVWQTDQLINERGIPVDRKAVEAIHSNLKKEEALYLDEMRDTIQFGSDFGGLDIEETEFAKLKSPRQAALFRDWINSQIPEPHIKNVQAATIEDLLKREDYSIAVRQVLEIRQALSKSSSAKYETILAKICRDGTLKDCFMYHGGRTGRWAGRGFQPQNLPRAGYSPRTAERLIGWIKKLGYSWIKEIIYRESFFKVASRLIRPMVTPVSENEEIVCADYSSIEARGLAWLAGEKWKLEAFFENQPIYELAASKIYGKVFSEISPKERQTGKMLELACGYGGGPMAVVAMCRGYGVESLLLGNSEIAIPKTGERVTQETSDLIRPLIDGWRQNNLAIVTFWRSLENTLFDALRHRDIPLHLPVAEGAGNLQFKHHYRRNFLTVRLPSRRKLYYHNPHIRDVTTPWGQVKPSFCYWGVSSQKEKVLEGKPAWGCLSTHGGKMAENITQALCRDFLAEALVKMESDKTHTYRPFLHAHDEAAVLVKKGEGSLEEFCDILIEPPSWAPGFPLSAEGWRGERYRK